MFVLCLSNWLPFVWSPLVCLEGGFLGGDLCAPGWICAGWNSARWISAREAGSAFLLFTAARSLQTLAAQQALSAGAKCFRGAPFGPSSRIFLLCSHRSLRRIKRTRCAHGCRSTLLMHTCCLIWSLHSQWRMGVPARTTGEWHMLLILTAATIFTTLECRPGRWAADLSRCQGLRSLQALHSCQGRGWGVLPLQEAAGSLNVHQRDLTPRHSKHPFGRKKRPLLAGCWPSAARACTGTRESNKAQEVAQADVCRAACRAARWAADAYQ